MNRLYTENKSSDYNFKIDLAYIKEEKFNPGAGLESHFRLCLIENSGGLIRLGSYSIPITGSCCLCLNEEEAPEIITNEDTTVHTIYFKPSTVNGVFTFENIRGGAKELPESGFLDRYYLTPFLKRDERYRGLISPGPLSIGSFKKLFSKVKEQLYLQAHPFWPCRSRSYLLELLNLLFNHYSHPAATENILLSENDEDINKVIIYLNSHYGEKITIKELCTYFNTNRTTLSGRFQKAMQMSIIDYLTRIRVEMAGLMLRDTNLPVYEIAGRVGYEDLAHFGRVFKKANSSSPSEYREHYKKKPGAKS